jgi:hypothetical protein
VLVGQMEGLTFMVQSIISNRKNKLQTPIMQTKTKTLMHFVLKINSKTLSILTLMLLLAQSNRTHNLKNNDEEG